MPQKKRIALINGPYNGRWIEDIGSVEIKMRISTDGDNKGATIGYATYEPTEDRSKAFYLGNTWQGTLEDVIPH